MGSIESLIIHHRSPRRSNEKREGRRDSFHRSNDGHNVVLRRIAAMGRENGEEERGLPSKSVSSTTAYSMFPRVTDYSIYKPCRMILNRGTHTGREFAGSITGIRCLSSRSHIALLFLLPFTLPRTARPRKRKRRNPHRIGNQFNLRESCQTRILTRERERYFRKKIAASAAETHASVSSFSAIDTVDVECLRTLPS